MVMPQDISHAAVAIKARQFSFVQFRFSAQVIR
jgi:hypothetical protein